MIIHKRTRQDIVIVTEDELCVIIQGVIKGFKRFNENNSYLIESLLASTFDSSNDFKKYIQQIFPRNLIIRLPLLGMNPEEIADRRHAESIRGLKSAAKKNHRISSCFCIEFWMKKGYSDIEAKEKVSEVQSKNSRKISPESHINSSPRRIEHWLLKGYSDIEAKEKVSEVQRILSQRCIEHWLKLGFSEEESKKCVFNIQSRNAKEFLKQSTEVRRKCNRLCEEYWLDRGLSEAEIKQKKIENGYTFSLQICIDKYGEDLGYNIWKSRQIKWQETLKSKSPEEIANINSRKFAKNTLNFSSLWQKFNKSGILYCIEFGNHVKIGITTGTLESRYDSKIRQNHKTFIYEFSDVFDAYVVEQTMMKKYTNSIMKDDYGVFGWTEVIRNTTLDNVTKDCDEYINRITNIRSNLINEKA